MMKRFLILVLSLIVGGLFLSPAFAADPPIIEPGRTLVPDDLKDLIIIPCSSSSPGTACSIPPSGQFPFPQSNNIVEAKIEQIDCKWVELSMTLNEPVPTSLPNLFFEYGLGFRRCLLVC